jgi:hypothetical protein
VDLPRFSSPPAFGATLAASMATRVLPRAEPVLHEPAADERVVADAEVCLRRSHTHRRHQRRDGRSTASLS